MAANVLPVLPGLDMDVVAQQLATHGGDDLGQRVLLQMQKLIELENMAAHKIQRCWFSYRDRQLFSYYKELISFNEIGDPRAMLASINPQEASLLDPAAPARVRFRLGGSLFPPTIYYKIFVAGLVDVNALAPRDYTAVGQYSPKELHLNVSSVKSTAKRRKGQRWYRRVDNNAWRPITDKAFLNLENEAQAPQETNAPPVEAAQPSFHWSSKQRRVDRAARQRKKRIEWMKKLYMGEVDESDIEKGMDLLERQEEEVHEHGTTDAGGGGALDDAAEVDALLAWAQDLPVDFKEYHSSWLSMGTSYQTSADIDGDWGSSSGVSEDEVYTQDYTHRSEMADLGVVSSNPARPSTPASKDVTGAPFVSQGAL